MAVWTKKIKEDRTMRNNTNTFKHLLAALLTIAAFAAGHTTAWAQAPASIGSISYNSTLEAYEINSADNLRDLYVYVDAQGEYTTGGSETEPHNCAGMTFKMTADITIPHTTAWNDDSSTEDNYTSIGHVYQEKGADVQVPFSGTFDGDGHTISGIRIYKGGTGVYNSYKGIIGVVMNGTVRNVTIADARITGHDDIGGIVGLNLNGVVSNCHATATVAFRAIQNSAGSTGGIVGSNTYDNSLSLHSTVTGCTSAAVFFIANSVNASTCGGFGGIVGVNDNGCTVSDCTAAGVILPNLNAGHGGAGAIVGRNKNGGILTNNKYHSCLIGDTYAFNIGTGANYTSSADYNEGDVSGASLVTQKLFLYDDHNNTNLTEAYKKLYSQSDASTAHGGTRPDFKTVTLTLKGRTFYKDGTWNTLSLPFDVSTLTGTPLSGATIMELDKDKTAYNSETGVLTVAFKSATSISKKTPYIVKWTNGSDVTDPTFSNIGVGGFVSNTLTITQSPVKFSSTYAPVASTDGELFDAHNADNRGYHSYMTITAPTVPYGYTFDGWYTDDTFTTPVTNIPFGSEGTFILYTQISPNVMINLTATSATVFGESKYVTTFYHGTLDYQLPEDAKAHTASLDGAKVVFHQVGVDGNVIPHGTAVIVVADAASITLTKLASTEVTAYDGNILRGSDTALAKPAGTVYVLGIAGEPAALGFFSFKGSTIPAGKAYYLVTE